MRDPLEWFTPPTHPKRAEQEWVPTSCKESGGTSICEHGRQRSGCTEEVCGPLPDEQWSNSFHHEILSQGQYRIPSLRSRNNCKFTFDIMTFDIMTFDIMTLDVMLLLSVRWSTAQYYSYIRMNPRWTSDEPEMDLTSVCCTTQRERETWSWGKYCICS